MVPVKRIATLVKYNSCRHYFNVVSGGSFATGFAQQIQVHDIYFAAGL
jgi:hypothetical protein